ncbi:hypothetical protein KSF_065950 [Reticulibacter mediterranei]|uniref:Uncharacterized protein n=1 Tax=Reticulibacter mediterranei TaxID=2778369 RepID=A0A8J3N310_9CHLR|nr:hypothetical protein [Reticulibacter mediterranei]GHO96547.1 hypothetical protein KSF_065950 [Reticulibacter mediterranei]
MRPFPLFWYERLIPPPWIWTERLQQSAEEEARYPRAIRHRFAQAYRTLARVETVLWAGRLLPWIEDGREQGYLTEIYYEQTCTLSFSVQENPWRHSGMRVIRCATLASLEQALAALHLPTEPVVQPVLFPEDVLAELEQEEQGSSPVHIPLTRDLWYREQLTIAPQRCW